MKIIQSLDVAHKDVLAFRSRYNSPEVHWLSIAYSCLLLRKYHPDKKIGFYGNKPVLNLLLDNFNLPYDEWGEVSCSPEKSNYYAWGKIEALKKQKDPYIHIDHDIFIGAPLPDELFGAELITQHEERDKTFYRRVLNYMQQYQLTIPDYMEELLQDEYVPSYNHGLFGGTNLEFIDFYLKKIDEFVDENEPIACQMNEAFLLCVVFEQWLFYALCKKYGRKVTTYYKDIVYDFKMLVPEIYLSICLPSSEYVHLMRFKESPACNNMIVRNMYKEFPEYYETIMQYLYDNNHGGNLSYFKGRPRVKEYIPFCGCTNSIIRPEQTEKHSLSILTEVEFLAYCRENKDNIIRQQNQQQEILEKIGTGEIKPEDCVFNQSSYVKTIFNQEKVYKIISYNFFFDRLEYIKCAGENTIYWDLCAEGVKAGEVISVLIKDNKKKAINSFITFLKTALFHNIIVCSIIDK